MAPSDPIADAVDTIADKSSSLIKSFKDKLPDGTVSTTSKVRAIAKRYYRKIQPYFKSFFSRLHIEGTFIADILNSVLWASVNVAAVVVLPLVFEVDREMILEEINLRLKK